MSETKTEGLIYKGHPLRRIDNLIYYGTMADPYIVMMQILESKKENGLDMATKVSLQLQSTNPNVKARDRVVKKGEKSSRPFCVAVKSDHCRAHSSPRRQPVYMESR